MNKVVSCNSVVAFSKDTFVFSKKLLVFIMGLRVSQQTLENPSLPLLKKKSVYSAFLSQLKDAVNHLDDRQSLTPSLMKSFH